LSSFTIEIVSEKGGKMTRCEAIKQKKEGEQKIVTTSLKNLAYLAINIWRMYLSET